MISLAIVRAAVLAEQPWTKLDAIVRAEMAAGRKVKEIFSDLKAIKDEVWDTPGLSEDGEDAFGDALDALTGNCLREYCYLDPPALPTEVEITELPRWARVAFAARCARRVLTVFRHLWGDKFSGQLADVTRAVELAERSATYAVTTADAEAAVESATAVTLAVASSALPVILSADAEAAIVNAAATATNAAEAVSPIANDAKAAANAAANAANAVEVIPHGRERAIQAIARDFQIISAVAQVKHWNHATPVPPDVFGPLWPEGAPPRWPADTNTSKREELPLGYLVKDGVLPVVVVDEVVNLFNALNRYHIARCGVRLTLEGDIFTLLTALVPAGGVR